MRKSEDWKKAIPVVTKPKLSAVSSTYSGVSIIEPYPLALYLPEQKGE
jgi:hypothetical protein